MATGDEAHSSLRRAVRRAVALLGCLALVGPLSVGLGQAVNASGDPLQGSAGPVTQVMGPRGTGTNTQPTWAFVIEDGATATCRLDIGAVLGVAEPCPTGSVSPAALPDGPVRLTVVQTDAQGNAGEAAVVDYTVDTLAPAAPTFTGPTGTGQTVGSTWNIDKEPSSRLSCRLLLDTAVQGAYETCSTPFTVTLPSDGSWQLEVRQTDLAGLTGPSALSSPYQLDSTAPAAPTVTGPKGPAQQLDPAFTISGSGGALTCALLRDGVLVHGFVACSSPFTLPLTAADPDGAYVVQAQVTDPVGNASEIGASEPYVLDRHAPVLSVITPAPTSGATPTWLIATNGDPSTLRCTLTRPTGETAEVACTTSYTLPDQGAAAIQGRYLLQVTVRSTASVLVSADSPYDLDTITPDPLTLSIAGGVTTGRTPAVSFLFASGDRTAIIACSLSRPSGVRTFPCASPLGLTETDLSTDGRYVLTVVATDHAGNRSAPASATYVLDRVAPIKPVLTAGQAPIDRLPAASWTVEPDPLDATLTTACTVLRNAVALHVDGHGQPVWSDCTAPSVVQQDLSAPSTGPGDYQVQARSTDAAGNVSAITTTPAYRYDLNADSGYSLLSYAGQHPDTTAQVRPGPLDGWTDARQAIWRFRAADQAAVTCSLARMGSTGETVLLSRPCDLLDGVWSFTTTLPAAPLTATYVFRARSSLSPLTLVKRVTLDREILPFTFTDGGEKTGSQGTTSWSFTPPTSPGDDVAVAVCALAELRGSVAQPAQATRCSTGPAGAAGISYRASLPTVGTWRLLVTYYDRAGNAVSGSSTYTWNPDALPEPAIGILPATQGYAGDHRFLAWTFPVATGVTAACQLYRDGRVLAVLRDCSAGSYVFDLLGQPPGVFTLKVWLSQVNLADSSGQRSYRLLPRVTVTPRALPPIAPPSAPDPRAQPPGTRSPASPMRSVLPVVRALPPVPPAAGDGVPTTGASSPVAGSAPSVRALPGQVGGSFARRATDLVSRPALPLALLLVVVLFLLVQNRIDRRDPKLAAAPVDGDPELAFGPVYRPAEGPALA